jgi:hypothetical protein
MTCPLSTRPVQFDGVKSAFGSATVTVRDGGGSSGLRRSVGRGSEKARVSPTITGERVGCYYEPREDLGMFWSNDPHTPIGAMSESLGLEEIDAQIARNRRLQDSARRRLAK